MAMPCAAASGGAGPAAATALPDATAAAGLPAVGPAAVAIAPGDSAVAQVAIPIAVRDPRPAVAHRRLQRALEVIPGLLTYGLILGPIALSLRWPEVVAWAVLTFDVYWLYKAVML